MAVWYEGEADIGCDIEDVAAAIEDVGAYCTGVVGLMPGLTTVELVDQGLDSVTIKTNEGVLERTNMSTQVSAESVVVEFDETYAAGSKVTTTSHFREEFTPSDGGVRCRVVISDTKAPGFLGFFYRTFGASKTGTAFLNAHKAHLETDGG